METHKRIWYIQRSKRSPLRSGGQPLQKATQNEKVNSEGAGVCVLTYLDPS